MKRLLCAAALLSLACTSTMTTPESQRHLAVKPDVPQRLAQLPKTVIDYDRSLLNENERRVVQT